MTRPNYVKHAETVVERITAVSRQRALSYHESVLLEHFIDIVDGRKPADARLPWKGNIILSRMGIKRDMGIYVERPVSRSGAARERARARVSA